MSDVKESGGNERNQGARRADPFGHIMYRQRAACGACKLAMICQSTFPLASSIRCILPRSATSFMRLPDCAPALGLTRPHSSVPVSYTHLRAHETRHDLVCRLLL